MNKKFITRISFIFVLLVITLPTITLAANAYTPLITCGNHPTVETYNLDGVNTTYIAGQCTFNDVVDTINRIINWIISIAGVIFTISAIWGGFLYVTSGEKPGNKDKAKTILWSTLTGFVIILVSWLIVYTILTYLVDPSYKSIFKFIGTGK
jgi:hypothetical protein